MNIINAKTDCVPELVGYDSTRISALIKHFERLVNEKYIHGASYCICLKGNIIANGSVGASSFRDTGKMQPDSIFGIYSITKVFTATAIMQLVENGLIRLDTPVGEILPQFKEKPFDAVTIYHLLTHSSGLYPDTNCFPEDDDKTAWELIDKAADSFKGKPEDFDWISAALSKGLRVPTGTQWQYCSFGFVLLGEIITRVSGEDCHDYIENHIIKPIGMRDSGFSVTKAQAKRCYVFDEEEESNLASVISGKEYFDSDYIGVYRYIPRTGGGLFSTAPDLIKFANTMLYGGSYNGVRVLGRKSIEKMSTIQLHDTPDYCWGANTGNRMYGVGFDMRTGPAYIYSEGTFFHEGARASSMIIDPEEELTAAWVVPFACPDWSAVPLYNTTNVIWSGLI